MDLLLQELLAALGELGGEPDPEVLSAAVRRYTGDDEYWQHQIDRAAGGHLRLHHPEVGPQVALLHRCGGVMSYVHSHRVWVALSPVAGVETHRRYRVERHDDHLARIDLVEERALRGGAGEVVTLIPPDDVHSHGHRLGSGTCPYTVVVLGDDLHRYRREEYDVASGAWRALAPGDRGSADLVETDPAATDPGPGAGADGQGLR